MNTKEVLIAAKAKIADPKNWTRFTYAKDAKGYRTLPHLSSAVCWCATGALNAITHSSVFEDRVVAGDALDCLETFSKGGIVNVNDRLGHTAVMEMFDKAIASL